MILALVLSLTALAAQPTTFLCEDAQGATKPAKIVVKAGGGHTLFACGTITKKMGQTEISAFKVFALGKNGKKLVFQASEISYRLLEEPEQLLLQEMMWSGSEKIPAFEITVSCEEKSCKASKPACAFEAPAIRGKKALEKTRSYMTGPKKGKLPSEKLIHQLAGLAYAGDVDALKIFQDRGPLRLDGAAGEAYFDHRAMLARLKKAGCFEKARAGPPEG